MIALIEKHRHEIESLCRKYRVKKLEIFGSAASGEFDPATSDIDFFYEFSDTVDIANRYFRLNEELEELLRVKVDLVSSRHTKNPYFLQVANRHRLTLYAA